MSRVVPNGHSQPHQERPVTRVKMTTRRASEEPTRKVLLDKAWARMTSGSRRMGKLTVLAGKLDWREVINKNMKNASEASWTHFRRLTQVTLALARRLVLITGEGRSGAKVYFLNPKIIEVTAANFHRRPCFDIKKVLGLHIEK